MVKKYKNLKKKSRKNLVKFNLRKNKTKKNEKFKKYKLSKIKKNLNKKTKTKIINARYKNKNHKFIENTKKLYKLNNKKKKSYRTKSKGKNLSLFGGAHREQKIKINHLYIITNLEKDKILQIYLPLNETELLMFTSTFFNDMINSSIFDNESLEKVTILKIDPRDTESVGYIPRQYIKTTETIFTVDQLKKYILENQDSLTEENFICLSLILKKQRINDELTDLFLKKLNNDYLLNFIFYNDNYNEVDYFDNYSSELICVIDGSKRTSKIITKYIQDNKHILSNPVILNDPAILSDPVRFKNHFILPFRKKKGLRYPDVPPNTNICLGEHQSHYYMHKIETLLANYVTCSAPFVESLPYFFGMLVLNNLDENKKKIKTIINLCSEVDEDTPSELGKKCYDYFDHLKKNNPFLIYVNFTSEEIYSTEDYKEEEADGLLKIEITTGEEKDVVEGIKTAIIHFASSDGNKFTIFYIRANQWQDLSIAKGTYFSDIYKNTHTLIRRDNYTLIHCSAGIGRTGVFIVFDLLYRLYNITKINFDEEFIYKVIKFLRYIRKSFMVQKPIQEKFLTEYFIVDKVSKEESISVLKNQDIGTYLIRESSKEGYLSISVKLDGEVKHIQFQKINDEYKIIGDTEKKNTIQEIIEELKTKTFHDKTSNEETFVPVNLKKRISLLDSKLKKEIGNERIMNIDPNTNPLDRPYVKKNNTKIELILSGISNETNL